ncbi:MAG TPA: anti-sigma factor RsbA family regulatory protein [Streptosporangiaceae bacterium]
METRTLAGPPRHAALLFKTAAEFAACVRDYVLTGGDPLPALVAATQPRLEALSRSRAPDRIRLANLAVVGTDPGRVLGMIRQFADEHGGAVRCVQEVAWPGRPGDELAEAVRLEPLIDLALATAPVSVLCAYDATLGPAATRAAGHAHHALLRDGRWQVGQLASERQAAWPGEFDGERQVDAADLRVDGDVADGQDPAALPRLPEPAATLRYREDQAAVRAVTAQRARAAGLSPDRVTDLVIAVGELAANTLAHTRGSGTLAIWSTSTEVICQVSDTGRIADPLAGTLQPGPGSARRGRGLWVVHQLCDLVQLRTGQSGTTVRLHMRLDG